MSESDTPELIQISGDQLVQRVRQLLHEGNVRRIRIAHAGQTVLELPLTVGVVGVVLLPMLAAVGALAALLSDCTIEVERHPEATAQSPAPGEPGQPAPTL